MNWPVIASGLFDELLKISEINLSGLSPENVIKGSTPPPPMETVGFSKARDILGRAEMSKTSATKQVKRMLPTNPAIGKLTHQGDDSTAEKVKSVGGYGLAGFGVGGAAHKAYSAMPSTYAGMYDPAVVPDAAKKFVAGARNNRIGAGLLAVGTTAGIGYGLHRQHVKSKQNKQAEMTKISFSPGMELKGSKQTAKPLNKVKSGPGLKAQTSGLIGRKGGIP